MTTGRVAASALVLGLLVCGVQWPAQAQTGLAQTSAEYARDILVVLRAPPGHARPDTAYAGDYGDLQARSALRREAHLIAQRHGMDLVQEGWPMPLLNADCFVMRARDGRSAAMAATDVAHEPLVAWSQPAQRFYARGDHSGAPLAP